MELNKNVPHKKANACTRAWQKTLECNPSFVRVFKDITLFPKNEIILTSPYNRFSAIDPKKNVPLMNS